MIFNILYRKEIFSTLYLGTSYGEIHQPHDLMLHKNLTNKFRDIAVIMIFSVVVLHFYCYSYSGLKELIYFGKQILPFHRNHNSRVTAQCSYIVMVILLSLIVYNLMHQVRFLHSSK